MVSRTTSKIRKVINPSEFRKITQEYKTFLLHLISNFNQPTWLQPLSSIEARKKWMGVDPMEIWLESIDLDLFEMPMSDAVEIMLEFGYSTEYIIQTESYEGQNVSIYRNAMLIIHEGKVFYNTTYDCYCPEGIVENIMKLDPKLILDPL